MPETKLLINRSSPAFADENPHYQTTDSLARINDQLINGHVTNNDIAGYPPDSHSFRVHNPVATAAPQYRRPRGGFRLSDPRTYLFRCFSIFKIIDSKSILNDRSPLGCAPLPLLSHSLSAHFAL